MSIKELIVYIIDGYRQFIHNPENAISVIAWLLPFVLAVVLKNNYTLWLLFLSPAFEGTAVYIFHWLFNV